MTKKIIFILTLAVFCSLGLKSTFSAQKYSGEDGDFSGLSERFSRLETKLEALSKNIDSANKEIAQKLGQVLSNQEKILKELAIVKIRASKI